MFSLQISAHYPYLYISNKTWHIFYLIHGVSEYEMQKFLFIHHKSISSSIHPTFIMPGIKEAKHFTKTASSDSKSEDLHDDSIYIVKHQTKFTIHSKKEWKSFH